MQCCNTTIAWMDCETLTVARMVQSCCRLCFHFETLAFLLADGNLPGQEFDSDFAFEFGVFGFIHYPHAAFAEFFEDFVVRNGFANHSIKSVN